MEDRDDYPIIPQPEGSEQPISDKEPYFHLSKNEHGKMWLMYRPEGNGRYKCWEPITSEFWNEFDKLLRLELDNKIYKENLDTLVAENNEMEKELASLKEVVKELIPIAELYYRRQTLDPKSLVADNIDIFNVIDRAKRISDNK